MTPGSKGLIWNKKTECLPFKELQQLQLDRLQKLVDILPAKVPFYQSLFQSYGVRRQKIRTLADLKHLPFTTKAQLQANYPFGLFAEPMANVARLHATSGTTGKPIIVGYTKKDLTTWAEVCARSLAAAGVRPGDIIHNSYGYGLFTGGLGIHYGAEALGATVVPASGGRTQQQITLLQDCQAKTICSTPSYALNIAYALEELSVARGSIKLTTGIFGAEPWTEELRQQIQNKLSIRALDIYGLTEIIGPGVSMECWQNDLNSTNCLGLHIWEDHFLPEIIDPTSGEVLGEGVEGELVFTTLSKEALPLLRYRTGDISYLHREPCACGRTMVKMGRVRGRLDDMFIVRGVNIYPSEIERLLLQVQELSPHYQIVLEREKALDILTVEVELTEKIIQHWGTVKDDHLELKRLTARIEALLKNNLGVYAHIALMKPKALTRSEGKAKRIVDKRSLKTSAYTPV